MATSNLPAWAAQWDQMSGAKAPAPAPTAPAAPTALPGWASQWDAMKAKGISQPANPASGPGYLPFGPWNTGIKIPGWLNRGLSGVGEFPVHLGHGIEERLGLRSKQQVADDQKLDAPLNATTAGKVGNFIGGVATTIPVSFIPGADTVAGGALLGAANGLFTPTTKSGEVLDNTLLGAGMGTLGTAVGNKVSGWASQAIGRQTAAAADRQALNAERDAVLSEGRAAGLKVPPTAVRPNVANTALESVSGKAATRQAAEDANQPAFNALVRKDFELPPNKPLNDQVFRDVRTTAGKVYPKVGQALGNFQSDPEYAGALQRILSDTSNLESDYPGIGAQASQKVQELVKAANVESHNGESAVNLTKFLRNQAKTNFQTAFRTGNPEAMELAHAQQGVSNALEDLIERQLDKSGQGALSQQWKVARATIAKAHQAEAALTGNNVSARDLAAQLSRGKKVSGNMGLVAQFATHFPEVSRIPKSGAGVSKLAAVLGLAGEGGALWMHSPTAMVGGAALAGLPYATRGALMSGVGQRLLATPNYAPSIINTAALRALQASGNKALLGTSPILQMLTSQ